MSPRPPALALTALLLASGCGARSYLLDAADHDLAAPRDRGRSGSTPTAWSEAGASRRTPEKGGCSLEKVGESSSDPFEGGSNDVPISFIARRIEIEMRIMLGEQTDLKPIETKENVLF
jgi:hypothetical protein